MNKEDDEALQQFKFDCLKWATNIGFKNDELKEIYNFLNSNEFRNQVIALVNQSKNQIEYNQKITKIVFDKFNELLPRLKHNESIKNILEQNNITSNI